MLNTLALLARKIRESCQPPAAGDPPLSAFHPGPRVPQAIHRRVLAGLLFIALAGCAPAPAPTAEPLHMAPFILNTVDPQHSAAIETPTPFQPNSDTAAPIGTSLSVNLFALAGPSHARTGHAERDGPAARADAHARSPRLDGDP